MEKVSLDLDQPFEENGQTIEMVQTGTEQSLDRQLSEMLPLCLLALDLVRIILQGLEAN